MEKNRSENNEHDKTEVNQRSNRKPGFKRNGKQDRKSFTKSGVVAGFMMGSKNSEMVVIDTAAKVNSLVNLNEFSEKPKLGERFTFEVIRKNEDGSYMLSKSAFDKNSKKTFSDYLDMLVRRIVPVTAEILMKDANGYEVKLLNEKLNGSKALLMTNMDLVIGEQVSVVIANFVGDRIRCVLKVDEKLPVQPGDFIKGRIVSGNDFFVIMEPNAIHAIPESYEVNVYKADCGSGLDYDSRAENTQEYNLQVMWTAGRNVFCRLAEEELQTGEVYTGVIESIKHNGVFVSVKNNSVFVSLSEFAWGGYSDQARKKMQIGDTVKVYILPQKSDDTRLQGSLKMSDMKPFEEFVANYKVGMPFEVEVITVCKEDPKRKSKMVLVKPKDKKFDIIMTLYLSSVTAIEVGQTIRVAIKAITAENKVIIYLVNARPQVNRYSNNRFFAAAGVKYDCIVTRILPDGVMVALEDNTSVHGTMYITGSDQYNDGSNGSQQSRIKCFIEWKNGSYMFTPVTASGTAFGDLFGDIEY